MFVGKNTQNEKNIHIHSKIFLNIHIEFVFISNDQGPTKVPTVSLFSIENAWKKRFLKVDPM